jgi:lactate 2-monooxygenase
MTVNVQMVSHPPRVPVISSPLAEADLIMAVDGYPTLGHLTPEALQCVM